VPYPSPKCCTAPLSMLVGWGSKVIAHHSSDAEINCDVLVGDLYGVAATFVERYLMH
jgi:hypothetical protein